MSLHDAFNRLSEKLYLILMLITLPSSAAFGIYTSDSFLFAFTGYNENGTDYVDLTVSGKIDLTGITMQAGTAEITSGYLHFGGAVPVYHHITTGMYSTTITDYNISSSPFTMNPIGQGGPHHSTKSTPQKVFGLEALTGSNGAFLITPTSYASDSIGGSASGITTTFKCSLSDLFAPSALTSTPTGFVYYNELTDPFAYYTAIPEAHAVALPLILLTFYFSIQSTRKRKR